MKRSQVYNLNDKEVDSYINSIEKKEQTRKNSPGDMLSSSDAAEYINRPISAIYQLTHKKKIAFTKPGNGKLYIKRSELDNFLSSNPIKSDKESINDKAKNIIFGKHE